MRLSRSVWERVWRMSLLTDVMMRVVSSAYVYTEELGTALMMSLM